MRHQAVMAGQPTALKGSVARRCPTCDAAPGSRCSVWRVHKGERVGWKGYRVKPHPARVALST